MSVRAVVRGAAPVRESGGLRFTTRADVVQQDERRAIAVRVEVRNVGRAPARTKADLDAELAGGHAVPFWDRSIQPGKGGSGRSSCTRPTRRSWSSYRPSIRSIACAT